jgi:VanZ family protein
MSDACAIKPGGRLRFAKTWQGVGWAMVATVAWLSLTPSPPPPPAFLGWDKAQHFIAYGGLMAWYAMAFARHWRWPVFLVALGVGLEYLQGYGGVRNFDPADMVANTLGVALGLALAASPAGRCLAAFDAWLAGGKGRSA